MESPWASELGLEPDQTTAFERVAGKLKTTPAVLLRQIANCLVDLDRDLKAYGLGGVGSWVGSLDLEDADRTTAPLRPWASALNLDPEAVASFEGIASQLKATPPKLLWRMAEHLVDRDRDLEPRRQGGVASWTKSLGDDAIGYAATKAVDGLRLKVRPTGFMWPPDRPFSWTADECKAAMVGYAVKWPGAVDEFFRDLRGKWEMSDGYAMLYQS